MEGARASSVDVPGNGYPHHDFYQPTRTLSHENMKETNDDDDFSAQDEEDMDLQPQDENEDLVDDSTSEKADDDDATPYKHFVAHNKTMTCSGDEHALPFNNQIRGVNLGGWMVLEPWITPSLFYQFLGGNENNTAMDMYSFCEILGAEEANRQLRRHWETWVTEAIIEEMYQSGALNSIRLPVGDFMYKPYGPYCK